jgi:hypothetical protein
MKNAAKVKRAAAATGLLLLSWHAHAADRDASLINSFQVFCALEPPAFDRIDQKAAAMKLPVHQDIGQSQKSGQFARSKSWLVKLTTGPHELLAAEANGANGYVESCGISAPDPDGEAFKNELILEMKLGRPSAETVSADGAMRITTWNGVFGEGSSLQFVDASPKGHPGAMLFYRTLKPTKP